MSSQIREQLKRKIAKYQKLYEQYGTDEYKDKYNEYTNKFRSFNRKYPSSSDNYDSMDIVPMSQSPSPTVNFSPSFDENNYSRRRRPDLDDAEELNYKSIEQYSYNRDSIRNELKNKYIDTVNVYNKNNNTDVIDTSPMRNIHIAKSWWKNHQFKMIVFCCILIIVVIYIYNYYYKTNNGSWSLEYEYIKKPKKTYAVQSKGEIECRRVLEKWFKRPFPSARPEFLMNVITGKPLEIDCCNMQLQLGVEYNGKQHYQYTPGMHRNFEAFRLQQYRDEMKMKLCKEHNFTLIIVPYSIPINSIENFLLEQLRYYGYTFMY